MKTVRIALLAGAALLAIAAVEARGDTGRTPIEPERVTVAGERECYRTAEIVEFSKKIGERLLIPGEDAAGRGRLIVFANPADLTWSLWATSRDGSVACARGWNAAPEEFTPAEPEAQP